MSPATSVFLDGLRLSAAVTVFVNHCAQFWNPALFAVTAPIAHGAVVVFFVLSGYVIAYSTLTGGRDSRRYAAARLSRLYSVVLPALLLTFLLQTAGSALNPAFYARHSRGFEGVRYLLTGCFLQNVWHFSASPPTNAPFWSLSYEFWYYVLFGAAVFIRRPKPRFGALLALSLLVGPNILLLLPCWLAGVAIFVFRARLARIFPASRFVFALSLAVMLLAVAFLPPYPHDLGNERLLCSGAFLTDWATALAVGAAILSFDALRLSPPPEWLAGCIRYGANHTFSLYLYHYPLIAFATAAIPFRQTAFWPVTGVAVGVVFVVLGLSSISEARRSRWRKLFERGYDVLARNRASDRAAGI